MPLKLLLDLWPGSSAGPLWSVAIAFLGSVSAVGAKIKSTHRSYPERAILPTKARLFQVAECARWTLAAFLRHTLRESFVGIVGAVGPPPLSLLNWCLAAPAAQIILTPVISRAKAGSRENIIENSRRFVWTDPDALRAWTAPDASPTAPICPWPATVFSGGGATRKMCAGKRSWDRDHAGAQRLVAKCRRP